MKALKVSNVALPLVEATIEKDLHSIENNSLRSTSVSLDIPKLGPNSEMKKHIADSAITTCPQQ